jgi:hypothetical protein
MLILALGAGIGLGRGPFAARAPTAGAAQAARQLYTCGISPYTLHFLWKSRTLAHSRSQTL